jgi:hypothetical protein
MPKKSQINEYSDCLGLLPYSRLVWFQRVHPKELSPLSILGLHGLVCSLAMKYTLFRLSPKNEKEKEKETTTVMVV